jgi:prophage maintenance system killer protein
LLYYLANDHSYADGNKRIAWMSLTYLLRHYSLSLATTEDEAVSSMLKVAAGGGSADYALEWIVTRSVKVS